VKRRTESSSFGLVWLGLVWYLNDRMSEPNSRAYYFTFAPD